MMRREKGDEITFFSFKGDVYLRSGLSNTDFIFHTVMITSIMILTMLKCYVHYTFIAYLSIYSFILLSFDKKDTK